MRATVLECLATFAFHLQNGMFEKIYSISSDKFSIFQGTLATSMIDIAISGGLQMLGIWALPSSQRGQEGDRKRIHYSIFFIINVIVPLFLIIKDPYYYDHYGLL